MMFLQKSKAALAVATLVAVSGCTALGVLDEVATPLGVYDLRAPEDAPVVRGSPLALDVIIELPTTSGVLNNDRIMIRPDDLQAQYLPEVRWGDDVPVMMQTLMLRSLENTGGLRYVGRRPLAGSGDYAVVTELVDFHAELSADGVTAEVMVKMTSRLVRERDASIVASRTFEANESTASTETPALVEGFDRASDAILIEFADWTMSTLGRSLGPA